MGRFRVGGDLEEEDQETEGCQIITTFSSSLEPPPPDHSLSSSHPSQTTVEPFHYELSFQQQEQVVPQPKRKSRYYLGWALVAAVVANVVALYGPPAPPPLFSQEDRGWTEFFTQEGHRLIHSLTALASSVPYVTHWCIRGLWDDVYEWYDELRNTGNDPCVIRVPSAAEFLQPNHTTLVVGQPMAVSRVQETLLAWQDPASSSRLLLFCGTIGVGKKELARQIASRLTQHCAQQEGILEISSRSDATNILVQLRKQRHTAVILWDLSEHNRKMLPRLLRDIQGNQRGGVLLLVTTHVGSRIIHQYLKECNGDMEGIPKLELDLALRHELDVHVKDDVNQWFHAVAPFRPLGPSDLQEILQHKVQTRLSQPHAGTHWKELLVTPDLCSVLLDESRIEYIEWQDKRSSTIFSGSGAKPLEDGYHIMNTLTTQVQHCLLSQKARPRWVAVLGFDPHYQQGTVEWCLPQQKEGEEEEHAMECQPVCRFRID